MGELSYSVAICLCFANSLARTPHCVNPHFPWLWAWSKSPGNTGTAQSDYPLSWVATSSHGQHARPATLPCYNAPSTPLRLKWELLSVTILLGGVINADLSLLSTPVLCVPPSRPRRVLRRPSWKLDGSVCHQPADSCLLLYLSTSPLPELRTNKQGWICFPELSPEGKILI